VLRSIFRFLRMGRSSILGTGMPLEQALQHATTEMLAMLTKDYGLTATEASLLLGQAVEYEVANVFNPAYSVVCKVPKAVLGLLSCSQ